MADIIAEYPVPMARDCMHEIARAVSDALPELFDELGPIWDRFEDERPPEYDYPPRDDDGRYGCCEPTEEEVIQAHIALGRHVAEDDG